MAVYKHDKVVPFENSVQSKKQQVSEMFNRIAFRYDFLNRFLSAGIDRGWRKKAIKTILNKQPSLVLDVATGTADMPLMMMKYIHPEKIIGIDISNGMLELGRKKIANNGLSNTISLETGDSEAINFPDNQFDAITVSFGVRNFENLEQGLREMFRVLKPGGQLVILEFSKPTNPAIAGVYEWYCSKVTPNVGRLFSGSKQAYAYLNASVMAFPSGNQFLEILERCGYSNCQKRPLTLGIASIYTGFKPQ